MTIYFNIQLSARVSTLFGRGSRRNTVIFNPSSKIQ